MHCLLSVFCPCSNMDCGRYVHFRSFPSRVYITVFSHPATVQTRFRFPACQALAAECGPTVTDDGTFTYYPEQARVTLSDEIKSNHFDIVYGTNFKVRG